MLKERTKYITVVLEDIYQPHNASAVLRSCDCFGIQDVHIIENRNRYKVNQDVALGSTKWLNLQRYSEKNNNTADAFVITSYSIHYTKLYDISSQFRQYGIFGTT